MSVLRQDPTGKTLDGMVLRYLAEVNAMTGETMSQQALALITAAVIERWKFRSVSSLVLALKRGMESGKIFGKLSYPVINEWLSDFEESIEGIRYNDHLAQ